MHTAESVPQKTSLWPFYEIQQVNSRMFPPACLLFTEYSYPFPRKALFFHQGMLKSVNYRLGPVLDPQFAQNIADMGLDRF